MHLAVSTPNSARTATPAKEKVVSKTPVKRNGQIPDAPRPAPTKPSELSSSHFIFCRLDML